MKTMITRTTGVLAATTLAVGVLTGCSSDLGSNLLNQGLGLLGENTDLGLNASESGFSGIDVMFAQMMIPHHEQAVAMATLGERLAFNPEVKALATQIKAEQAPEISQMKAWLTDAGASMDMGHAMGMAGMLSESAMTLLENAKGAAFDKLFLEGMIAHHQGAITMAKMVATSANAEAKALAEAITSSQTEQIEYMKSLLAK